MSVKVGNEGEKESLEYVSMCRENETMFDELRNIPSKFFG